MNMTGQKKGDTGSDAEDLHDSIVRKELDAAMNSLQKRIDNLKGVDVKFPKKPNPFRRRGE